MRLAQSTTNAGGAGSFFNLVKPMIKEMEVTILAKGAPVRCSSGEISMCAIAVGDIGLIRIYPLTVTNDKDVRVWSRISIKARRSNKDPRHESWRSECCQVTGVIENSQEKSQILDDCILKSGTVDPINYQNENKSSIAIIKSSQFLGAGLLPRQPEDYHEFDEQESWIMTQDNYPFKPYLFWKSLQGGEHKTHIVAQEVYVGMRNFSATPFRVFENMHIGDADYDHWMVLGNMKDRRNVWVCPHLHRLKKTSFTMGLSLMMSDGRKEGWPYLRQEVSNVKDAGPQLQFQFTTDGTN